MKAKISRGAGFRGVLDYTHDVGPKATGQKKPERVGGNMAGGTVQELVREFGITKKLRPDCKNPVWHCSLALPEGDRLSTEKWGELGRDFMIEMGMAPANFLYDVVRHNDTGFDHIHFVVSRIGLDGSLWHGGNDVFLAIEATQKLEKKHGLTLTPGFDPEHKKDRKSLTHGELNMAVRTGVKPPRMVCQEAIDAVLQSEGVISAPLFIDALDAFGVRAVPSVASTGTMNGFLFEVEGVAFTGSKLGDSYKWAQLQKRGVEYEQTRDFESLAESKRVATERRGNQESGATATAGGRSGDPGIDATFDAAPGRLAGAGSLRPSEPSATGGFGEFGHGNERSVGVGHGAKDFEAGHRDNGFGKPGQRVEGEHDGNASEYAEVAVVARGTIENGSVFSEADAERGQRINDSSSRRQAAVRDDDVPVNTGGDIGRVPRPGWADRFKQASAAKRRGEELKSGVGVVGKIDASRAKVTDRDRIEARQIDPTSYLESHGFEVKKEGRHLSVRRNKEEIYRVTRKDDGHWVTCDNYENGIGDNIALVADLEPGLGFAESVYRLAGAPSVVSAMRPAPMPVVRQLPTIPAQSDDDVHRGRAYLVERGITLQTIEQAEKEGMLRYSSKGVLFVGLDDQGNVQNVMRRSIDPLDPVQKRDLRGTDKRHPQVFRGNPDVVLIVEGGTDALAAVDVARRSERPAPTVLVSGGANVRSWIETPWIQKILQLAKKVIVAFEREDSLEKQTKTDQAHELQMTRLREVCSAHVIGWKPPEGLKDMAELNLHQVARVEATASSRVARDPFPGG